MRHIYIGMKRTLLEQLALDLTDELATTPPDQMVEVELYGDVDEDGVILTISNEDMEREEVHPKVIYANAD